MASTNIGFFHLPREVRDEIYRYALVSPTDLLVFNTTPNPVYCCCNTQLSFGTSPIFHRAIHGDVFQNNLPEGIRWCQTKELPVRRACSLNLPHSTSAGHTDFSQWYPIVNIFLTCKDIYREALPILYGGNRFTFDERMLLILGKEYKHDRELELIPGPTFMSATAICFDFLMSLPLSTLPFIRRLKFYTSPPRWKHQGVFELLSQKTKVDDVDFYFSTEEAWQGAWKCDISTLPWTSPYTSGFEHTIIQIDVLFIYSLCKLTGLRRLGLTMVSGFKFFGPIKEHVRELQNRAYMSLMRLLQSKMLSREALRSGPPEIIQTSMISRGSEPHCQINQTIDHLHTEFACNIATTSSLLLSPKTTSSVPGETTENSSAQYVWESKCPICDRGNEMRYFIEGISSAKIEGKQDFTVVERYQLEDFGYNSWPDELDIEEFWKLVTLSNIIEE